LDPTVNIKVSSATDDILSLSGGHQQKVLLARCLATDPKVLCWTSRPGIDVGTKAELHRMIIDLARAARRTGDLLGAAGAARTGRAGVRAAGRRGGR